MAPVQQQGYGGGYSPAQMAQMQAYAQRVQLAQQQQQGGGYGIAGQPYGAMQQPAAYDAASGGWAGAAVPISNNNWAGAAMPAASGPLGARPTAGFDPFFGIS